MTLPLTILVLFGLLGMATMWWARGRTRRLEIERMPVLIGEAMMRHGITPADAASAGLEQEVLRAGESCRNCGVAGECRGWLASSFRDGPGIRCPNSGLFKAIIARRRPDPPRAVSHRNLGVY